MTVANQSQSAYTRADKLIQINTKMSPGVADQLKRDKYSGFNNMFNMPGTANEYELNQPFTQVAPGLTGRPKDVGLNKSA